jgi:hypothetical protein
MQASSSSLPMSARWIAVLYIAPTLLAAAAIPKASAHSLFALIAALAIAIGSPVIAIVLHGRARRNAEGGEMIGVMSMLVASVLTSLTVALWIGVR